MRRLTTSFAMSTLLLSLATAAGCDDDGAKSAPTATAKPTATASASTTSGAGVRFGRPKPQVGDEYTTTLKMENTSEVTDPELPGIKQKGGFGFDLVVDSEVLAVSEGRESKWKQTFQKALMTMITDGKARPLPSPVEGKTYIVERKGEKIEVTGPGGEAVPDDELRFVNAPIDSFSNWDLPDRPLIPGDEVPELAKQTDKELAKEGKVEVTARFVEKQGDNGLFERKMAGRFDGGSMDMTCRSTVRIADGRMTSTTCETGEMSTMHDDKAKGTGRMEITATRKYTKGGAAAAPSAAPSGGTASPFDAVCYGDKELTDKQRYYIQSQNDDGKDPCPGFAAPTVLINADGITVNGQAIVPKDKLPDADNLVRIEPLFKRLNLLRKRWKSVFPNKRFAGKLTIKPAPGTATAPVVSAYITAGWAGYPFARIETGALRVDLAHVFPLRPQQDSSKQVLYFEPLEGGKAIAGVLKAGPKLDPKKELANLSEIDDWLKSTCSGKTVPACTERIIVRPRKVPIEETVKALQQVLQAKSLNGNTIPVSLEFSCGVSPNPTRQEALKGPWGPRFPDAPCF